MTNKLMLNIVYAIALLGLAGSATACNYGADPAKNSTGYDAVKRAMDDCNYKGGFYLAELSESKGNPLAGERTTPPQSELVASQRIDSPVIESMPQRPAQDYSKNNDNDSENYDWFPAGWSDIY